jgi:hypothetical protein
MINIKAIVKAYLAGKKKQKEEGFSSVLLSQKKAEAFCEEYNLTQKETANLLEATSALNEVGEELELSLSFLDADYRGAKAINKRVLTSILLDYPAKEREANNLLHSPIYSFFNEFLREEAKEQSILIASILLEEEEVSWEDIYLSKHSLLISLDSFSFSYAFVAIAERAKGRKIETAEELLSLTGYSQYFEEEPDLEELVDTGGLFHTAGLYKYRRAIKRKMRRGATYKQLLAVKPSSFGLPSDLSTVDSTYNGSHYRGKEEGLVASSLYAWESKEAIVGALISDTLIGGYTTQDKKNRGYLIELYSKPLGLSFEELLNIFQTAERF